MNKIYISSLLIVLMAGAQSIRAQESDFDALVAEMDTPAETGMETTATAPASVESVQPAAVEKNISEPAGSEDTAQDLFSRGMEAYNSGDYELADKTFEAMLALDPYDTRAMRYLRLTAEKAAAKADRRRDSVRSKAIAEVDQGWVPDLSTSLAVAKQPKEEVADPEQEAIDAMTARLKSMRIPTLDFRDANIKDVILFLTETCRRMDEPSHKGINFILLGLDNSDEMGIDEGNNITISVRNMNLYDSIQAIVEMADLKFDVRANMVNIMPINYVRSVDMIEKELDVITEVGDELASMSGGGESEGGMDDLFGESSSVAEPTGPVDVKGYFSYVQWPDRSTATYYPAFKKLLIKNTPESIKTVKQIIHEMTDRKIRERSNQIQIEAKFVEFNEGALEELGFDWNVYGSGTVAGFELKDGYQGYEKLTGFSTAIPVNQSVVTDTSYTPPLDYPTGTQKLWADPVVGFVEVPNNGQNIFGGAQRNNTSAFEDVATGVVSRMGGIAPMMIFTDESVDLKISALQQEGTADVLSTPKVTTQSGSEAVIRVVEIHRYPQDYDVETGQRTAPVVKPQDWEDFDLGVVLRVTPDVDPEQGTILLQMEPEIRKFKGFEDYAVAVNAYLPATSDENTYGSGNELYARMPYFETRSVSTRVTVADGHTVMMGGLIDERTETFRDQVPFLGDIPYVGRLFRTEGSRNQKKNLVIYVTATQVDERGMTKGDRALANSAVN